MTIIDRTIIEFDKALRHLFAPAQTVRPYPAAATPEAGLSRAEKKHVAGLMRVNHCGEICAQALYQGQAMLCEVEEHKRALEHASQEETEHLNWTRRRLDELGGRTSLLNPLWYVGSLGIGLVVAKMGSRWNLGFLSETERQVEAHLSGHLERLPAHDQRSRAVLEQMKIDERQHASLADDLGGARLPALAQTAMKLASKVMTTVTYRL